ncbi:hypothetical protein KIPB_012935, partial [Kipferlia bialata]
LRTESYRASLLGAMPLAKRGGVAVSSYIRAHPDRFPFLNKGGTGEVWDMVQAVEPEMKIGQ